MLRKAWDAAISWREEMTSPELDAEPTSLCTDTLQHCFANFSTDGYQLAKMAQVCKSWREAATGDLLWEDAVRARWKLDANKKGKYKYGERSWREVFRVFHRRMRVPAYPGVSHARDVIYSSGKQNRVCCWLAVTHQPACRLAGREHWKVLQTRILIQNLRTSTVVVEPSECLSITFRDGTVSQPLDSIQSSTDVDGASLGGAIRLAPLEVALLTDVAFPVPSHMNYEPDVLEACHQLRLRASTPIGDRSAPLEVPCAFEQEDKIWKHYECISREFYVHVDHSES